MHYNILLIFVILSSSTISINAKKPSSNVPNSVTNSVTSSPNSATESPNPATESSISATGPSNTATGSSNSATGSSTSTTPSNPTTSDLFHACLNPKIKPDTDPTDARILSYNETLCSCGIISQTNATGGDRLTEANAINALAVFNDGWNNGLYSTYKSYLAALSAFFNGPPDLNCDIGQSACDTLVSCGDVSMPGSHVNNPAGWLILNSISNIHNSYTNQDDALYHAESYVSGTMDLFVQTFSPQEHQSDKPKISVLTIIDIVRISLAVVGATAWGGVLFQLPAPIAGDFAKDMAKALVQGGLRLTGSFFDQPENEALAQLILNDIVLQAKMSDFVSNFVLALQKINQLYVQNLFSGNSTGDLMDMLSGGLWLDVGSVLPLAWGGWNSNIHPVIIPTGVDCNTAFGSDYMSAQTVQQTKVCYAGQTFFVVNVDGTTNPNVNAQASEGRGNRIKLQTQPSGWTSAWLTYDSKQFLTPLPGSNELDGTNWGGITLTDIVASVYEAYKLNGNRNGYKSTIDALFSAGLPNIQSPGVFTGIPICSADLAFNNWLLSHYLETTWDEFPCGSPPVSSGFQCSFAPCMGRSDPTSVGMCLSSVYAGYPCANVCNNQIGGCTDNGCNGINDPDASGSGYCQGGAFNGCPCSIQCDNQVNSCASNGCGGSSLFYDNGDGRCTEGRYIDCRCASTCDSNNNGTCSDSECGGENNCGSDGCRCTTGSWRGCWCNK